MLKSSNSILALDVGGRRIGIAVANIAARFARPFSTFENNDQFVDMLKKTIIDTDAAVIVVGLPRGLDGQDTAQTAAIRTFITNLEKHIDLPFYWQDEAVTSKKAEAELKARKVPYDKGEIDALAATYILEDFLHDHPEIKV